MKNCIKCTSPIGDTANFCPICGTKQIVAKKVNANFCVHCGSPITHNSQFCTQCGNQIKIEHTFSSYKFSTPPIITSLSSRISACAFLWIIIASIQLLCGLIVLSDSAKHLTYSPENIFAGIICAIMGFFNLKEGIRLKKYKKAILIDYVGIIWENKISWSTCFYLIWNGFIALICFVSGNEVAIFFSILLASAILVDLFFIKLYIKRNRDIFLQLEKSQVSAE